MWIFLFDEIQSCIFPKCIFKRSHWWYEVMGLRYGRINWYNRFLKRIQLFIFALMISPLCFIAWNICIQLSMCWYYSGFDHNFLFIMLHQYVICHFLDKAVSLNGTTICRPHMLVWSLDSQLGNTELPTEWWELNSWITYICYCGA